MKKNLSHYESLNVTRDAPAEVIRAAYRSLSQRHHPDKNSGDPAAAEMMMRLNTAYEVLSDPEQRLQYDRQMLEEQLRGESVASAGAQVLARLGSRQGKIAIGLLTTVSAAVLFISWNSRKDDNVSTMLAQSAVYASAAKEAANTDWPTPYYVRGNAQNDDKNAKNRKSVTVIDMAGDSGLASTTQEPASAAPAAKAPAPSPAAAPVKQTEFERLASMLKSMGLGLHKLETEQARPAQAAAPAPAPAASTAPAPAQSSRAANTPEPPRAREEAERAASAEQARSETRTVAEASRPAPQAAAPAPAASAQRGTLVADARDCPTPTYPDRAFRNGETGTVLLSLLVGTDGRVLESKVQKSSGYPELDKATRKAVAQCKFKAAEGQTEPVWTKMVYAWSLD